MKSAFTIEIQNGGAYYALFYFLAFLTGLIILIIEGRKRKFPLVAWLLVITTSFLFFMVGTQFIKFSSEDWQRVWQFKALDHSPGRSVLGGILFAIPGLLLAKHFFKFRYNVMDAFAWALPVGMLIQRVGCLMAGCCYGTITSVPWSIQYGANSYAFNDHIHNNLIPATNTLSLPIHPVPLYEVAGCILILILLFRIKRYLIAPGNFFIASIGLYALVRFFTEFFRAISFGIHYQFELTKVHVTILIIIPILIILIVYRERALKKDKSYPVSISVSGRQGLIYFLFISLVFLFVSRWLSPLEVMTLNLVMLPALLFITWQVFKSLTVPKLRWATLGLMIGSMVMMSQTLTEKSSSDSLKYNTFSFGFSKGNYTNTYTHVIDDCNSNQRNFKQDYTMIGAGFSSFKKKGNNSSEFGVDAFGGTQKETWEDNPSHETTYQAFGAHGFYRTDAKWIGIGVGLTLGKNIRMADDREVNSFDKLSEGHYETPILPSASIRIGPRNILFGEYRFADAFPTASPAYQHQVYLGSGFGSKNGFALKIGAHGHIHSGSLVAITLPIHKLTVDSYFIVNGGHSANQYAISLKYHYNKK